ncbi:c-type cytochrome [Aurantiacibacter sp. MUD11]|uniref:c-type cytochrome n=1 Tax=Aurantiacibacter sp. MUD11 TaxID=3003265 RepID=UPI0022AAB8BB|nr:c-type cytochrome [Aurantiacibacter sp. MUD11]WAT17391.1 c-type cytochrome [Aurantiacibacter sp. MUD11]
MTLAACGGPPEAESEADATAVEETTDEATDVAAVEGEGEAVEADAEEATEAPAPVASATPTARPTPTATATVAAAPATPPAAFSTCGVCHSVEPGQNGVGPTLAGVVGRRAGSVAGANYSPAMQGANITWTEANLRRYLLDPNAVVPGGTMPAPGLNAAQAQAVVNYLKTL